MDWEIIARVAFEVVARDMAKRGVVGPSWEGLEPDLKATWRSVVVTTLDEADRQFTAASKSEFATAVPDDTGEVDDTGFLDLGTGGQRQKQSKPGGKLRRVK